MIKFRNHSKLLRIKRKWINNKKLFKQSSLCKIARFRFCACLIFLFFHKQHLNGLRCRNPGIKWSHKAVNYFYDRLCLKNNLPDYQCFNTILRNEYSQRKMTFIFSFKFSKSVSISIWKSELQWSWTNCPRFRYIRKRTWHAIALTQLVFFNEH